MLGKELVEKKMVSLVHVKHMLDNMDREGKEPTYEQNQTMEYSSKFAKLSHDKAESLYNNLLNIHGLSEEIAVKIVDFLPEDAEALKILLPKPNAMNDSQIADALSLVQKYAPGS